MKLLRFALLMTLFMSIVHETFGQDLYVLDPKFPVHDINPYLRIYEDSNREITHQTLLVDTVLAYKRGDEVPRFLKMNTVYWGKIHLSLKDSIKGWTLNFEDYSVGAPAWTKGNGKVDVFAYKDDKLIFHKKSGVEYDIKERDIRNKWVLNRIRIEDLPVGQEVVLLIKAQGNKIGYPASFKLSMRSPKQAHYHELYQFNNSFNLFTFGATVIVLIYHLLMFFYTRQRIFLWFSIWLSFCATTMAMSVGLIIGSITTFRFSIWMIIANGVLYSFWFFGRAFINTPTKFPRLDKVILTLSFIIICEIFVTALYVAIWDVPTYFTGVGIHYILLVIYSGLSFCLAVYLIFSPDQFAKYFGVGAMIGSLAYIVGGLWSMNIIRPVIDPYAWSMLLQLIIFSFGIAYRRQQLENDREEEKLRILRDLSEAERVKDLEEVKSRFFANISHEFRTPLSLISGPLELAARSSDMKGSQEASVLLSKRSFSIIKKNADRLETLVDQLLELSKIESGQIYLNLEQGGLVKFIRSLVASFQSMAERKNISLHMSFVEELPVAYYDKDKLEKIISNLLSNAFKYTSMGGSVSVIMDVQEKYYTVEISDTGKGIGKKDLKKIFDRFYRIEGTEKKGSGIGLALTKELVDLHNGQISVDSIKGQGTTFKVRMPFDLADLPEFIANISSHKNTVLIRKEEVLPVMENVHQGKELSTKLSNGQNSFILLVEDNLELQEFIGEILAKDFTVLSASDGLQGERMAFEHVPDLIITDVMMPGKDGYELCHAVKSNAKTSHIPIIMLTAKAGKANRIEGLMQGADDYITKPFDDEELLIRVRNLLAGRLKMWEHFKSLDLSILPDVDIRSAEDEFFQSVIQVIKDNLDNEKLSVETLARNVGFSRSQLHRKLKALLGKSATQLITEIRLNEAFNMLQSQQGTVSEIAYSVGYSNMSYFTRSFKERFDVLPSKVAQK